MQLERLVQSSSDLRDSNVDIAHPARTVDVKQSYHEGRYYPEICYGQRKTCEDRDYDEVEPAGPKLPSLRTLPSYPPSYEAKISKALDRPGKGWLIFAVLFVLSLICAVGIALSIAKPWQDSPSEAPIQSLALLPPKSGTRISPTWQRLQMNSPSRYLSQAELFQLFNSPVAYAQGFQRPSDADAKRTQYGVVVALNSAINGHSRYLLFMNMEDGSKKTVTEAVKMSPIWRRSTPQVYQFLNPSVTVQRLRDFADGSATASPLPQMVKELDARVAFNDSNLSQFSIAGPHE